MERGFDHSAEQAALQHKELVKVLQQLGIRCHLVPAAPGMPDLAFARDATFMTPWGLLLLNPAAAHRRPERDHVERTARSWGVRIVGAISQGNAEGGDICLLREGIVIIGYSGERTNKAGAQAVADFFRARGWRAICYAFDPYFLHLDTQFTMLDRNTALACVDVLDQHLLTTVRELGVEIIPVTSGEVQSLGANVLSIGNRQIVAAAENARVNRALTRNGFKVLEVALSQFTNCGGGVHCLTMPLRREGEQAAGASPGPVRRPMALP